MPSYWVRVVRDRGFGRVMCTKDDGCLSEDLGRFARA